MDIQKVFSQYESGNKDFSDRDLKGASFKDKTLNGADFTNAKLNGADFTNAKLNDVKFDGADIRGTNFTKAKLKNASFRQAILGIDEHWTIFLIIGAFFTLVLSAFPLAVAFWWIPLFFTSDNIKSYPIFVIYIELVTFGFLYLIFKRKTEEVFAGIIGISALTAGLFGLYGIYLGKATLPVGMVISTICIGAGMIVSATVGAASLRTVKVIFDNLDDVYIKPYYKLGSSYLGYVLLVIIGLLSLLASGYITAKCAAVVIANPTSTVQGMKMRPDADGMTVLVTGIGGALSILLSFILSFSVDKGKHEIARYFSNRVTAFKGSNFSEAVLNYADFEGVIFYCTNLDKAIVIQTNWKNTKGHNRVFKWVKNLQNESILNLVINKKGNGNFNGRNLEGVNLEDADLSDINFDGANLTNTNFKRAILTNASFIDANLAQTNLQEANLKGAKLVRTNLHDADLTKTTLTGACIDAWGRTATTKVSDINCEYIYMKLPEKELDDPHRQPYNRNFEEGEFDDYITEYFDTIDLYHKKDFNIKSSIAAILKLQEENPESKVEFAGLKPCGEDNWLFRIKVEGDRKVNRNQIRDDYHLHYYNFDLILSNQQRTELIGSVTGKTEHRIFLVLGKGNFTEGFLSIKISIEILGEGFFIERGGKLPANPQLPKLYLQLMKIYLPIKKEEIRAKLKGKNPNSITKEKNENIKKQNQEIEENIKKNINKWLSSDDFAPIVQFIRDKLPIKSAEILFCIETEPDVIAPNLNEINHYSMLRRIPWHLWHFLDEYRNTEITFTRPNSDRQPKNKLQRKHIRVLSILGDDTGINIQEDKKSLELYLAGAEIFFLEQKSKEEILNTLNDTQGWDIICFSGHRSKNWNELAINSTESLPVEEIKDILTKVIQNGLQLIILNTCDTLRFARELESIYIPQVIVMREDVPDVIAYKFLASFLKFFKDHSVAISMRKAREELAKDDSIGAWIPILCQNAAERQVKFTDLPRHYS